MEEVIEYAAAEGDMPKDSRHSLASNVRKWSDAVGIDTG